MTKIRDKGEVKRNLKIGEIKCSDVWRLDNQEKLNGNSLKAFERDLETMCMFEKIKQGRSSYYRIKEIYLINKVKDHGNKTAMQGNVNKKNKITFCAGSDSEFIAAIIINKLEYFENNKDETYKTLNNWNKVIGLRSESSKVNLSIKRAIERNFIRLQKAGLVYLDIKYNAIVNNEMVEISKEEFDKYRIKSKKAFREAVGETTADFYKEIYNFIEKYDWQNKDELMDIYYFILDSDKKCVFKTYKVELIPDSNRINNPIYKRLHEVIFNSGNSVQDSIENFKKRLGADK